MVNKKKVNIQSIYPLYVFTPPLTGVITGAELTYPEIYSCLGRGATIHEVLSDGSELRLTYQNYNKINEPEPKVEEVVTDESDVIPPAGETGEESDKSIGIDSDKSNENDEVGEESDKSNENDEVGEESDESNENDEVGEESDELVEWSTEVKFIQPENRSKNKGNKRK